MSETANALREFQEALHDFAWDLAWRERREDSFVQEARKRESTDNVSFEEAALRTLAENPMALRDPCLRTEPSEVLAVASREIAAAQGLSQEEASAAAYATHPDLVALDELRVQQPDAFLRACRGVGGQIGGRYSPKPEEIVARVLEWADQERRSREYTEEREFQEAQHGRK